MRYLVDEALCCGHGQCALFAPEVYSLDDDGINSQVGQFVDVDSAHEESARVGAMSCPDAAIRIFE